MVAIIIIGLVIAVWWFKGISDEYEQAYAKEKAKNENFTSVIILLKKSEVGFKEDKIKITHTNLSKTDSEFMRRYIVFTTNETLHIEYLIKAQYKYEKIYFKFSINEIVTNVSDKVIKDCELFTKDFKENYKIQMQRKSNFHQIIS